MMSHQLRHWRHVFPDLVERAMKPLHFAAAMCQAEGFAHCAARMSVWDGKLAACKTPWIEIPWTNILKCCFAAQAVSLERFLDPSTQTDNWPSGANFFGSTVINQLSVQDRQLTYFQFKLNIWPIRPIPHILWDGAMLTICQLNFQGDDAWSTRSLKREACPPYCLN